MREATRLQALGRSIGALARDVAMGWRRLRATPLFTIFAVLSLAVGIGVTTAAYSAMYALGARPTSIRNADRVLLLTTSSSIRSTAPARVSWADYQDLRAQQRGFADLIAWAELGGVFVGQASTLRAAVEAVDGRFFSALGVRPALGRLIVPADDRPDGSRVMVLSDAIWRRRFAANPAIVGTTVRFAQQPFEIVGVAPASFLGATSSMAGEVAGWVPLAHAPGVAVSSSVTFDPSRRDARWLHVAGRLQPDTDVAAAVAALSAIGRRLDEAAPLPPLPGAPGQAAVPGVRAWRAIPLDETSRVFDSEGMRLVVGLPFLLLLIACTNLANLVLSRGSSRRHEIAVRRALGASRGRLVREQLVEMTLVALAGGALGALVAHGLLMVTSSMLRETIEILFPALVFVWRLEPVVFAAAGVGALLSVLVAGVAPAFQMTRVEPGRAMTIADPAAALPRWRGRGNLIAVQVGVSSGLFLVAVIAVRFLVFDMPSHAHLQAIAAAAISFEARVHGEARANDLTHELLAELRRTPNVAAVAAANALPLDTGRWLGRSTPVRVATVDEPWPERPAVRNLAALIAATPGLEQVLGVQLLGGRFVEDGDRGRGVTVDTRLAERLFGTVNVVGRTLRIRDEETESTRTIVGVTAVVRQAGERVDRRRGVAFVPFAERTLWEPMTSSFTLVLARASSGDGGQLVTPLRTAARRVDQDLVIGGAGRGDLMASGPRAFAPFIAGAFGSIATLSLVLAMTGLYGVLSHVVARRRREMGIRLALGASRGAILALVLKSGLRPVVEGLLIGLGVALVMRQVLQMGMTETLSTVNVATFALAAVPLLAAGLVAAALPAHRAARVDPNVVLREM